MRRGRTGRKPSGRGFSLMEVLVALVVIVFGLWGILELVAANQGISRQAARRAAAIELAGAKMAEIQAAGFDRVEPLLTKLPDGASTSTLYPATPAKFEPPYDTGTYSWQARFVPNGPRPDVVNVEMRVFLEDLPLDATGDRIQRRSVAVGALLVKK